MTFPHTTMDLSRRLSDALGSQRKSFLSYLAQQPSEILEGQGEPKESLEDPTEDVQVDEGHWVPAKKGNPGSFLIKPSDRDKFINWGKKKAKKKTERKLQEELTTLKYHVVSETTPEDAAILLTQGVKPSFKRKIPVTEYRPGHGIDRDNLYVMYPNATTKGSFGPIRLHLRLRRSQLDLSQEMKQLGYTDLEYALSSSDGAVTQGYIPKEAFVQVEIYSDGNWKTTTPLDFLRSLGVSKNTPSLPTIDQYRRELEKHTEEWFLTPERLENTIRFYNRANLQDKIELAREINLIPDTKKKIQEGLITLKQELEVLRPQMAAAAQQIYDSWDPDEEGLDYGGGGPCDEIASALAEVIIGSINAHIDDGGHEGDDHAFLIVSRASERYWVDIASGVCEQGGGYSWQKTPDIQIGPKDIVIEAI